jgi:hypothetical protein
VKPRTVMSSIMRARNALTGRGEEAEVIGGVLFELKVAGPSMLAIGCPDGSRPSKAAPGERRTFRWRKVDSNRRSLSLTRW